MKKRVNLAISIILVMALVLSIMPYNFVLADENYNSDNVSLYVNSGSNNVTTGSIVTMYAGVNLSGMSLDLDNSYEIITVPKKYLNASYNGNLGVKIIKGEDSEMLKQDPVITSDTENYYIRYDFNRLAGGNNFEFPFAFQTLNNTVVPDTTFTLNTKLYNENDNLLAGKNVTITNKANCKAYTTGRSFTATETSAREGNPTTTSSNENENIPVTTSVYYELSSYNATSNSYKPSKIKLVVKPELGVVVSGSSGWTYNTADGTYYKYVSSPSNTNLYSSAGLSVKMPGVTYGAYHTAYTVYAIGVDNDDQEIASSKSSTVNISVLINKYVPPTTPVTSFTYRVYTNKSLSPSSYTYTADNKDKISTWNITTNNASFWTNAVASSQPRSVLINNIDDYNLNSHLYYYSVKIDQTSSTLTNKEDLTNNVLYGIDSNNQKIKITEDIPMNEVFYIPSEYRNLRRISVEFPDKVKLAQNANIKIVVETKVFDSDWDTATSDNHDYVLGGTNEVVNTSLYNYSTGNYYYNPDDDNSSTSIKTFTNYSSYYYDYYKITTGGTGYYNQSITEPTLFQNDYTRVQGSAYYTGAPSVIDGQQVDFENGKIIFLLPNGYEYVNDSTHPTQISYYIGSTTKVTIADAPQLQYDYKGTGKRALIINLPSENRRLASSSTYAFNVYIWLKTIKGTPIGNSNVISYLAYDNNNKYGLTPSPASTDTMDLNGDGLTNDRVGYRSSTITYTPNHEIVGVQLVGKDLNSLTQTGTSSIDIGGSFYYGMNIFNMQQSDNIKAMSLINILPSIGDRSITTSLGEYSDRGSTYRPEITGPVMILRGGNLFSPADEGYTVSYSTSTPIKDDISADLNEDFSTSVDDYSKVTMIKIDMNLGTEIPYESNITFVVPASVPMDVIGIKDGDIAFDSFAYAGKLNTTTPIQSEDYIEAYKAGAPVSTYTISGNVYNDFNMDSFLSQDEKGVEGINLGLYDSENNEVGTTETTSSGDYNFGVMERGNYTVKVINLPANMELSNAATKVNDVFPDIATSFAKKEIDNKVVDNDVNEEGVSSPVTVNPDTKDQIVNISLKDKLLTIPVEKQWIGVEIPPVDSVEVSLTALDQTKTLTIYGENDWKSEFAHIRKYDANGDEIEYTPNEVTSLSDYRVSIQAIADGGYVFKNIIGDTVNVSVTKKWIGTPAEYITVNIFGNGELCDTKALSAADNWQTSFTDLPKYDPVYGNEVSYTIEEMGVPGYTDTVSGDMYIGFTIVNTKDAVVPTPQIDNNDTPKKVETKYVYKKVTKTVTKTVTKVIKTNKGVKTGDNSEINIWLILIVISLVGIGSILVARKRFKKK
ncbi:MAG: Cna B-type domain-containing protein [Lachnospiraceae bacterium]|jgi:hypothetical protein|nr:Cna B-type domain-containing protein [Lachnospiraceae bacterium]